ncbi:KI16B protein, partial [Calyptomena viridis]|nr:KI16B protein [Calyptomena viridis]
LDQEIQQLKQKIYEGDGAQKGTHGASEEKLSHSTSPASPTKPQPPPAPLVDDRINAFIEQEVQRRLQNIHHKAEDNDVGVSWSTESLKDNERLNNGTVQRKLKYERMVCRSLGANPDDLKDPIKISIPRYVLCGQGKDEHYEFEIKITVLDETWTVFRRYSRFREMHKTLKLKYPELATLEFPPKKLFGNKDERVIAERRSHLEKYLRSFFSAMLKSPSSPLHIDKVGLTLSKYTICEFSPFFRKGVFDYSSHGTS